VTKILAFETSCDDTCVAVYDTVRGLLAHQIHSQIAVHQPYGGVVPELASRDHSVHIAPLLASGLALAEVPLQAIDAVAYTKGPGLIGALLVGATFARSLAFARQIPSVGVHHLEAHLLAPMLEADAPSYPFLVLLISGGHTQLIQVREPFHYQLLGESLDDAVGEAFDKTAKMMGLSYPGGPIIEKLAHQGDPKRWVLPRPMLTRAGLDFSFSGLKSEARRTYSNSPKDAQARADLAVAFELAAVECLVVKCRRALRQTGLKTLVVAGGVAANQRLRQSLASVADQEGVRVFYPRHEFCTDNAAMVAYAGAQRLQAGVQDPLTITVLPRWPISDINTAYA
jgi:tRNA N6-adenosine threonylcarbamoyltransferase